MVLDVSSMAQAEVYHLMIQTIVPRPIAWVLSENPGGGLNLAPFSFFNGIGSNPPLLMISVGRKPDGTEKDTWANIKARDHFVVHIPSVPHVKDVSFSSGTYPLGESELDLANLSTAPMEGAPLPRVEGPKAAFACRRYAIHEVGAPSRALILGQIHHVYLDDAIVQRDGKGRRLVDVRALNPLARLGGDGYTGLGDMLDVPRPP